MAYKLSSCVVLLFQGVVMFILPQPSCPWSSSQERTLPSLSTDCQVHALTTTFMSTLCCYGNNCFVKWKGSLKFICGNFLCTFTHKISSITRHFYKKVQIVERSLSRIPEQYFTIVLTKLSCYVSVRSGPSTGLQ